MKVEIIHGRDPDNACEFIVFVDGERVTDIAVEDLDPGRGWQRSEWNDRLYEAIETLVDSETPYNQAIVSELTSFADNRFIDEDGSPDISKMAEPHKCDNADGDNEDCHVYYDETAGDGNNGLCPSCADAETSDSDVLREIGMTEEADVVDEALGGNI